MGDRDLFMEQGVSDDRLCLGKHEPLPVHIVDRRIPGVDPLGWWIDFHNEFYAQTGRDAHIDAPVRDAWYIKSISSISS